MVTNSQMELKIPKMMGVYVGMGAMNAKMASNLGLEPPVILTDVYAGYFASKHDNWGIIEIDTSLLFPDSFAPFHGYIEKSKRRGKKAGNRQKYLDKIAEYKKEWKKSLADCGVYLYLAHIPPNAISRIATFKPDTNDFIRKKATNVNPWEITAEEHKNNYWMNYCVATWLACSPLDPEIEKSKEYVKMLGDFQDRSGLELYHFQTERERNKGLFGTPRKNGKKK